MPTPDERPDAPTASERPPARPNPHPGYRWYCDCGAAFDRYTFDLTTHIAHGRKKKETHHLRGLVKEDTGEVVAPNRMIASKMGFDEKSSSTASSKGLLNKSSSGKPVEGPAGVSAPETTASLRGRFVTQEVELDSRILVLYDLACTQFPAYQPSVGEFIFEIVTRYFYEHADELQLGRLFPQLLSPDGQKQQKQEVRVGA